MKIAKETKKLVTYQYHDELERNDHLNSYGKLHVITRVYGDGVDVPLMAEFKRELRYILNEKTD